MPLLTHTIQPPLISLLNSNAIPPVSPLWTAHTDPALTEDSVVCVVMDDEPAASGRPITEGWESTPGTARVPEPASLVPKHIAIGSLSQPVIHLQSPTIRTTYLQSGGALPSPRALGLTLPWLGIQMRRLGARHVCVEVGVVDPAGREGRIRMSTFQVGPRLSDSRILQTG